MPRSCQVEEHLVTMLLRLESLCTLAISRRTKSRGTRSASRQLRGAKIEILCQRVVLQPRSFKEFVSRSPRHRRSKEPHSGSCGC